MRTRPGHAHFYESTPYHHWVHWGWGRGGSTNSSAGVAIAISSRQFKQQHVVRINHPPQHLQ
eukprot:3652733-Pyramimonas_sp.AAC.1